MVVCAACSLALCGFSPLGNLLLYALESRFPPWDASHGAPDGIVVLGGPIDADLSVSHDTPVIRSAPDRIVAAAMLAHRYPNARIVFTGGSPNLISNDAREADFASRVFEGLGVDKARLIMERRSRNTLENALFTQGAGRAEARRALAARHLGLPHAALGRPVPQGGIYGRTLSGGLAGRRDARRGAVIVAGRGVTAGGAPTPPYANGWVSWPIGSRARPMRCSRGRSPISAWTRGVLRTKVERSSRSIRKDWGEIANGFSQESAPDGDDALNAPAVPSGQPPEPQAVVGSLTRAAIFLVATINAGSANRAAVRSFCADLPGLLRAVGFRDLEGNLSCVMGIGSDAWDRPVRRAETGRTASLSRDQGRPAPCGRDARRPDVSHPRQAHGSLLRACDSDHDQARRRGHGGRRGARLSLFRRPRSARLRRRHRKSDGAGRDRCRLYRRRGRRRSPAAAT